MLLQNYLLLLELFPLLLLELFSLLLELLLLLLLELFELLELLLLLEDFIFLELLLDLVDDDEDDDSGSLGAAVAATGEAVGAAVNETPVKVAPISPRAALRSSSARLMESMTSPSSTVPGTVTVTMKFVLPLSWSSRPSITLKNLREQTAVEQLISGSVMTVDVTSEAAGVGTVLSRTLCSTISAA